MNNRIPASPVRHACAADRDNAAILRSMPARCASRLFQLVGFWLLCCSAASAQLAVQMVDPQSNVTLTAPATFVASATAWTLGDGEQVTSLTLYSASNAVVATSQDGASVSHTFSGVGPGSYVFYATATDNTGRTASTPLSATVTVVAPGGNAPSVSVSAASGPFIAPASIALSATASDSDGTVSKVEFFANGNKIGEDAAAPYQLQWTGVAAGNWSLTAKATDNSGVVGTSAAVAVTVDATRVIGNIDGVAGDAVNGYYIRGWACSTGRTASISVHLYAGGPYGSGTFVKGAVANKTSEPAVASSCLTQAAQYRFEIPLTAAERQAHGNKTIHVHGIAPEGGANNVLSSSGVHTIPASLSLSRKYVYDAQQRLCKIIEPETGATIMDYDAADNLAWTASGVNAPSTTDCNRTDAATLARKVSRTYDGRNRLTNLRFPDGRGDQDWSYTPDGLPAEVTTFNSSSSGTAVINRYAYNTRRQPKSETVAQPGWYEWTLAYGYDGYGNLASLTYPTGLVVDYAPNALGQPTKAGSYASNVSYYANGAIRQFTYGNGIVHTLTQNQRQLPQTVRSVGISGYDYQYDRNGNPTRIDDLVQGANFTRDLQYDVNDRLVAAGSPSFGGDHWHRFTYDGLDNLRSWKLAGVKDYAAYVYDAKNQLTSIRNSAGSETVTLSYGVQGNLATKNSQSYDFDYGNRLRDVPGKESYRYDAHGRRVTTLHGNGGKELWQYSQSGQMLFSFEDTPSQKTHEQVYLAGSLIASIDHHWPSNQTIATRYQHTDALGSPVAVSNETGQLVERTQYEPYGSPIGKTVDGIGYTGHVMDGATGLTYMQQRYYDQTLGRFLSVDPIAADPGTGKGFSRYTYSNNSPYSFFDPDGREAEEKNKDKEQRPPVGSVAFRSPGSKAYLTNSARLGAGASKGGGAANAEREKLTRDRLNNYVEISEVAGAVDASMAGSTVLDTVLGNAGKGTKDSGSRYIYTERGWVDLMHVAAAASLPNGRALGDLYEYKQMMRGSQSAWSPEDLLSNAIGESARNLSASMGGRVSIGESVQLMINGFRPYSHDQANKILRNGGR